VIKRQLPCFCGGVADGAGFFSARHVLVGDFQAGKNIVEPRLPD